MSLPWPRILAPLPIRRDSPFDDRARLAHLANANAVDGHLYRSRVASPDTNLPVCGELDGVTRLADAARNARHRRSVLHNLEVRVAVHDAELTGQALRRLDADGPA